MKKFKALYYIINDDLKDSEMFLDYACELKEKDREVSEIFAREAQSRLEHFEHFNQLLEQQLEKETPARQETVDKCLWEESHKEMVHCYEKLKEKLAKHFK